MVFFVPSSDGFLQLSCKSLLRIDVSRFLEDRCEGDEDLGIFVQYADLLLVDFLLLGKDRRDLTEKFKHVSGRFFDKLLNTSIADDVQHES